MRLRTFHLLFIAVAILFCFATSVRSFQLAELDSNVPFMTYGRVSLFFAMVLIGYGGWFLRTRKLFHEHWGGAVALLGLFPFSAEACSSCYGTAGEKMVEATNQGTAVLMAVTLGVLLLFVGNFYRWLKWDGR